MKGFFKALLISLNSCLTITNLVALIIGDAWQNYKIYMQVGIQDHTKQYAQHGID